MYSFVFSFFLYFAFYYVTLLYLKCSIVLRVRIKDDDDDDYYYICHSSNTNDYRAGWLIKPILIELVFFNLVQVSRFEFSNGLSLYLGQ